MPLYVPSSGAVAATQAEQEAASSTAVFVSPGRQQFHPAASKCWVNFNSAGTIAASYNTTSITDNGVGDWVVNIGTDFSSANFSASCSGGYIAGVVLLMYTPTGVAAGTCNIQAARRDTGANGDPTSPDAIFFISFGDQ